MKRKKLDSFPKIYRRLYRLWSLKVRALWEHECAIHGNKDHDKILDCHHLESRQMCKALRWDPLNGILLCKTTHKYGKNSVHQGPVWFFNWFRKHHRPIWKYVLKHRKDPDPDIRNREVLAAIEENLIKPPTDEEREMIRDTWRQNA